jgi:hypothetical protein
MTSVSARRAFLIRSSFACAAVGASGFGIARSAFGIEINPASTVTPFAFGARGDGRADDTNALNAAYEYARQKRIPSLSLRGGTFRVTRGVYARGVSTAGEGATIVFTVDAARGGAAFEWGGSDNWVERVTFDLSNTAKGDMQGVLNAVNDARNQRFQNNRVIARTTVAGGKRANIFGAWFMGTGLSGLFVTDNQFESCYYGVQVDNQKGIKGDVRRAPLGKPSEHVHIAGNVCVDASIGVNTPHIQCSNVVIEGNTLSAKAFDMDLPVNIAHVTNIAVLGNTMTSNAASANGTLHVEDATGAVAISGNIVSVLARNNGIQVGTRASVSGDAPQVRKVVIAGNHVDGGGAGAGILIPDVETVDTVIGNNVVQRFDEGITVVARCLVQGNVVTACRTPLRLTKDSVQSGNLIG